jgi:uncharacterized protein (DUF983 family)
MLHALCPRCRVGPIFKGSMLYFGGMHERCAICGLKYQREQGYFLGAMYISYFVAVPTIAIFTAVLWKLTHWGFTKVLLVAAVAFLPLVPLVTNFSRVLWIYLDRAIDPE